MRHPPGSRRASVPAAEPVDAFVPGLAHVGDEIVIEND